MIHQGQWYLHHGYWLAAIYTDADKTPKPFDYAILTSKSGNQTHVQLTQKVTSTHYYHKRTTFWMCHTC